MFTDIEAAFEEMEFLVEDTGKTHLLIRGSGGNKYYVNLSNGKIPDRQCVIAELNCRNVIGQKEIDKRRSKSISFEKRKVDF